MEKEREKEEVKKQRIKIEGTYLDLNEFDRICGCPSRTWWYLEEDKRNTSNECKE